MEDSVLVKPINLRTVSLPGSTYLNQIPCLEIAKDLKSLTLLVFRTVDGNPMLVWRKVIKCKEKLPDGTILEDIHRPLIAHPDYTFSYPEQNLYPIPWYRIHDNYEHTLIAIGLKQTGKVFVQRLPLTDRSFITELAVGALNSFISFPKFSSHYDSHPAGGPLTNASGLIYNLTVRHDLYNVRRFEDTVKMLEDMLTGATPPSLSTLVIADVTLKNASTDTTTFGTSPYWRSHRYETRSSISSVYNNQIATHGYNDLVLSTKTLNSVLTGRNMKARILTKYALFKPGTNLKVFKTLDAMGDYSDAYLSNPLTGKRTTYTVPWTRVSSRYELYNRKDLPKHANINDGDNNYATDDHKLTEAGAYGFLTLGSRDPAVNRLGSELSDGDVIATQSWLILSDETISEDMWPDLKDEMNPCAIPLSKFMVSKLKVVKGYIEKLTEIRLDGTFKRVRNGVETSYTFGSNPTVDLKPLDKLVFKYAVTTEPGEPDAAVIARGDKVDEFVASLSYNLVNRIDDKDYQYYSSDVYAAKITSDMNEITITIPDNEMIKNIIKYRGGKPYYMWPNFYMDSRFMYDSVSTVNKYTEYRIQRYYNGHDTTRYKFKVTFNN